MRKEARMLLAKSLDSLVLAIERFNSPWDRGRQEVMLILLDRAFELLLKSAILHKGGRIREAREKETIGFDKCVRKCVSEEGVKCLTNEQALTVQIVNSLRDAAQHYMVHVSEQQLYLYAQAGVTLYGDIVQAVFGQNAKSNMTKTETYEERAKRLFTKEAANMKLLVVVDKLLTGFDAPPCTYLYIDKSMQDHGLFQAICRVNRLDGEDKDFGYIVDYKDLFKKVENAFAVYTSELDHSAGGADPEVLLQDRLKKGKERLDNAIEGLALLCEPVEPPKGELEHIHYFCGNTEIPANLKDREPRRAALYKAVVTLVRTYANIADELEAAGYGAADIGRTKQSLAHYLNVREIIRKASGETLDLKAYEADMRHLIDTYIEADEPRTISPFDNMGLLELIVKTGIANAIASHLGGLKGDKDAIAETIENNVRRKIIQEQLNDPAYYEKMSTLLDEIITTRKAKAIEYEEYLKRIADLARRAESGLADDTPELLKNSRGLRALYNNLKNTRGTAVQAKRVAEAPGEYTVSGDPVLGLAVKLDAAVKRVRPDGWRGVQPREQVIKAALYEILRDEAEVERIFPIIKAQGEY